MVNTILFLKSLLDEEELINKSYFFNCIDPPTFSSFSTADFDAKSASIFTLFLISPVPKILSFIVPNILLSIVFFFLLTPLSIMSKIFKSQSDYKKKNDSDTTFVNRKKFYEKKSIERMW